MVNQNVKRSKVEISLETEFFCNSQNLHIPKFYNLGESGASSNGGKFKQRQYLAQYLNQEDRRLSPKEPRKGSYLTVKSSNFNDF